MTTNSDNSGDKNKPKRKLDKEQLLTSIGIALGLVLIIFGFRATQTGRDESGLPDVIERMSPPTAIEFCVSHKSSSTSSKATKQ